MSNTAFEFPKGKILEHHYFTPSIHWAGYQRITPRHGNKRRLYDCEIMIVLDGRIEVTFADYKKSFIYQKDDLLFLPPAVPHQIIILPEDEAHLLGIHFDLYNELEISDDLHMVVDEEKVNPDYFCFWPLDDHRKEVFHRKYSSVPHSIINYMEKIASEFQLQKHMHHIACQGYMILILGELLRLSAHTESSANNPYRQPLYSLTAEWSQALHLDYANDQIAARFNMSQDHFIRIFRKTFGMPPQQYLQHLRHQAAKRLLHETDLSIQEIGACVGYEDPSNFSHVFKKWQGLSASAYRKRSRII